MKVQQLALNQFVIIVNDNKRIFQSYDSIIAIQEDGKKTLLSCDFDYSKTTMKYLKMFLGHNIYETRKRIKKGIYLIAIDTDGVSIN